MDGRTKVWTPTFHTYRVVEIEICLLTGRWHKRGILLALHDDHHQIIPAECTNYTLSARIKPVHESRDWWITMVYGPQLESEKLSFLNDLRQMGGRSDDSWLLIGDFNFILNAEDKNNTNLNQRLMRAFRSALNDLELKELALKGRKFTWTNSITNTRIDRAFCSHVWDLMFPNLYTSCIVSSFGPLSAGPAGISKKAPL